jgi:hypothetical protein
MTVAVLGGAEFGDFDRWLAEMSLFGIGGMAVSRNVEVDQASVELLPRELPADWLGDLGILDIDPEL